MLPCLPSAVNSELTTVHYNDPVDEHIFEFIESTAIETEEEKVLISKRTYTEGRDPKKANIIHFLQMRLLLSEYFYVKC